jgi:exopolyphosphatase/guanosine-5'-triphosphate,3'-diphosphate pyrophosphatase
MSRVGVVDFGSNSTRLLLADVDGERITDVERRSTVTRLAEGLERTGRLGDAGIARVLAVLDEYREAAGDAPLIGVMTSAVRDAANGEELLALVRERGVAARIIPGEEEARLTFRGATSDTPATVPTVVIDVGGGSTEFVVGVGAELRFHHSTQVGVVRHGERHDDVGTLRADAAQTFAAEIPRDLGVRAGIATGGTATQSAAVLGTPELSAGALEGLLERLAAMTLEEREQVDGLDPARAPTIVAGLAILLEAMAAVGIRTVSASPHDILRGAALEHTGFLKPPPQF